MRRFALVFGVVLAGGLAAGQDAVTIKVRPEEKGDKVEVAKSRDGTATVSAGGQKQTKKEEYLFRYTETVLEKPAGAARPTKAERAYAVARKTDPVTGELAPLFYSGKTVDIEVSPLEGVGYLFLVKGTALQPPDVDDFNREFQGGPKGGGKARADLAELLPKKPVKVGEEWAGDDAAVAATMGGDLPFTVEKEKSKLTGKLVKTYQKDGARWGVIEMKIVLAVSPGAAGPAVFGTITSDVTFDLVIDGSSRARSVKLKGAGVLAVKDPKAGVKLEMSVTQEETVTPVK